MRVPSSPRGVASARTGTRRRLADRLARVVVAAGGLAVIASILGILIFIVVEVWPLLRGARVSVAPPAAHGAARLLAFRSDEYRELLAGITEDGDLAVVRARDGELVERRPLAELLAAGAQPGASVLSAATADGDVVAVPVDWEISYPEGERRVAARWGDPVVFALDEAGSAPLHHSVSLGEDGAGFAAAVLADGSLALARRTTEENLLTGEVSDAIAVERAPLDQQVTSLLVDHRQQSLYAGTHDGGILWWSLRGGTNLERPGRARGGEGAAPVTALTSLIGGRSLVVGAADGSIEIWQPVRAGEGGRELRRIRELPRLASQVRLLAPSQRDKSFLAAGADGALGLYHSTSGRRLWSGSTGTGDGMRALDFAPRADGAFAAADGVVVPIAISNPHPETTLRTLFGRIWYEGYDEPALVWQSSGGSDDFEPKLSLTPLVAGTLKGTFFSLLLAIPIGVASALYVSQFMHPIYQRWLKPMVEVMAALPTVVLGFLAGLWLAPKLERVLPGLALAVLLLPPLAVVAVLLWRELPGRLAARLRPGSEVFFLMAVLGLGLAAALASSPALEAALFGGDFKTWLETTTGMRYDQRNAVVVGLAMGFAVIPIIFAISEDALSNVPRNLVAGSLALGASRWQTVLRVVLPTASPGIFSAVMVGFGRAVGETMIVLMATGNTPIMSWSPWNGFRTLAANIAVEIPEAPVGGTLYRTLFLAALVLFVLTFLINTAAELVRQRLRERFSRL